MSALERIFQIVIDRLSGIGMVTIAGGSVRDTLMEREPKDYDVFINCSEAASSQIVEAMEGFQKIEVPEFHKSEPFLKGTWRVECVDVQVMWTPHGTVDELLNSFDWNVSMFAYDGSFHCREDVKNIKAGASLRLCSVTFPISTLRRGFRFSERFGMKIERKDLFDLCKRVMQLGRPEKKDASA